MSTDTPLQHDPFGESPGGPFGNEGGASEPAPRLNPEQERAVSHHDGPLLVIAGPGSGKTRVMTSRIARLVASGVPAPSVLAITFTNKAAAEMRRRALLQLGGGETDFDPNVGFGPYDSHFTPQICTFHSFCARLLRKSIHHLEPYRNNFNIYDTPDQRSVVENVLDKLELDRNSFAPTACLSHISRLKNDMVKPDEAFDQAATHRTRQLAQVYKRYQEALVERNGLDFDDLLLVALRLLRESEHVRRSCRYIYRHILVDEFQDTNRPQYLIARLLAEEHRNLCVTGDPDQSIYSWRGASPENFQRFMEDFPEYQQVNLDQNYRSTPEIVQVAARLTVGLGEKRNLRTDNPSGDPVVTRRYPTEKEEARAIADQIIRWRADGTALHEISVLYRMNALSRNVEEELTRQQIPYVVLAGTGFYQRKEVKDILAYLRFAAEPRDEVALLRVINTPSRGIGKVTIDRLQDLAAERGVTLGEVFEVDGIWDQLPGRARTPLREFMDIVEGLRTMHGEPLTNQVEYAIERSGYLPFLEKSEPESWREREQNLVELISAAQETAELLVQAPEEDENPPDPLSTFLERVALATDVDRWDEQEDRVVLMTLHAAKGLEFDRVVLVGVEDAILPHSRSDEEGNEEEERRLLFVGITRARKTVQLTYTSWRRRYRDREIAYPSRFLKELIGGGYEEEVTTPDYSGGLSSSWNRAPRRRDFGDFDEFDSPHAEHDDFDYDNGNFDEGFADDGGDLRPGTWLDHDLLGKGVVTATSGYGESMRIVVKFDEHGEKQISPASRFRIIGHPQG